MSTDLKLHVDRSNSAVFLSSVSAPPSLNGVIISRHYPALCPDATQREASLSDHYVNAVSCLQYWINGALDGLCGGGQRLLPVCLFPAGPLSRTSPTRARLPARRLGRKTLEGFRPGLVWRAWIARASSPKFECKMNANLQLFRQFSGIHTL